MRIDRMLVNDLRILRSVEIELSPGLNVFVGPNGAGKTSILEAVHLLGYGRSFRSLGREALVRQGAASARVFAELRGDDDSLLRVGIERSGGFWRGRVNDSDVNQLSELFRQCAICCFEPGSHELVSGGAEARRAALDWGVFHVEPSFLTTWRRYQRALRQRNALIKESAPDAWFFPWEAEMASAAVEVTVMREKHLSSLAIDFTQTAAALLPEFSNAQLSLATGWKESTPQSEPEVMQRLVEERPRDRERGHTRRGPHRADWNIRFDQIQRREHFSRGQEKLVALTWVLTQLAELYRARKEWPLLLLDDLASELDARHKDLVLEWVQQQPVQVLMTGVERPVKLVHGTKATTMFHVERGIVEKHH